MHNSCKTYTIQIIPLHLKKKRIPVITFVIKNFPIDNFLQYILNPFCNREVKTVHKSFEEMSLLLIQLSVFSFPEFVEFSTTQDVMVLNLHQTIRLDNSVAAVNWREDSSHSLHLSPSNQHLLLLQKKISDSLFSKIWSANVLNDIIITFTSA